MHGASACGSLALPAKLRQAAGGEAGWAALGWPPKGRTAPAPTIPPASLPIHSFVVSPQLTAVPPPSAATRPRARRVPSPPVARVWSEAVGCPRRPAREDEDERANGQMISHIPFFRRIHRWILPSCGDVHQPRPSSRRRGTHLASRSRRPRFRRFACMHAQDIHMNMTCGRSRDSRRSRRACTQMRPRGRRRPLRS